MSDGFLSTSDAAQRLAISRATIYQWLAESDAGTLAIRGQPVTVDYLQGGPNGQGRIKIEAKEVERLKDLMRVRPQAIQSPRRPRQPAIYPGITVKLGRPDQ